MLCGHCIAVCPQDAIIYEDFGDVTFTFEGIEKLDSIVPYDNLYKFLRGHRSIRHYKKKRSPERHPEESHRSYAVCANRQQSQI